MGLKSKSFLELNENKIQHAPMYGTQLRDYTEKEDRHLILVNTVLERSRTKKK